MFSRMFFAVVGVGVGVAVGVWTIRKLEGARAQLAPEALASRAGAHAAGLGERLSVALDAGRVAAEQREAELRAQYLGTGGGPDDAVR